MSVSEVCRQIVEKTTEAGGEDHGLFQPAADRRPARWLRMDRTLQYYDLRANDELQWKKKHRPMKVRLLDDTVKTILIDDSKSVGDIVDTIGKKIGIKNPEEFSLQVEGKNAWLTAAQSLHEQGVGEDDVLLLKKRFFVDDANVGRDDPVQLHLVYVQSRDGVVEGSHPCTAEEAISFCALQCQIQFGNHNPAQHKSGFLKVTETLPPSLRKDKGVEKKVVAEYRKLVGMSEINAKYRYVQLCRSLKTYGITFFSVKHKQGNKKPVPRLLGITRDNVLFMDEQTKQILQEYPLDHLKRWAASPASFTLDFGDYESDYINVVTNEGETISQLLAGYIDILLKKRKEIGVVLDDDGSDVGTVQSIGKVQGQAIPGITTSVAGGHDQFGFQQGQLSPQQMALARKAGTHGMQTVQVENVDQAQKAVSDMLNDMQNKGSQAPGQGSALTPIQWKNQLQTNANSLAGAAGKLVDTMNAPGGLDRNQMNAHAKEIAMACGNMVSAARNASAGLDDDDMPLFDGAQAVAEAIKNLLQASKELAASPNDPDKKAALERAANALKHAQHFLQGACDDKLADEGSRALLMESAKALADATKALAAKAEGIAGKVDPKTKQHLLDGAQKVGDASTEAFGIANALAPIMLDPAARQALMQGANQVEQASGMLLAGAKGGANPADMDDLSDAAKRVNDAISQMLAASQAAEPKAGKQADFADAANQILLGAAQMLGSKGKTNVIKDNAQNILEASGKLIGATKTMTADLDDDATRARLLACARQVADATKNMMGEANNAAANPGDNDAFERLTAAAKKLADATKQLVGDAATSSAQQQLRHHAKMAAAQTTALISSAHNAAASSMSPADSQGLLDAAKAAADAIKNMITLTGNASQNPDNAQAQQELLQAAQKASPQAFALVANSKQAAPNVKDPNLKQDLIYTSTSAGDAIKGMLEATKKLSGAVGAGEIDEALEQFQAADADLESAIMFADSGNLKPAPGQTRENAIELVNVGVRALAGATKQMATAKEKPDQLGPASKNLGNAVSQVVDAAKAVASTSQSKATQKAMLGAAKHLNGEASELVKTARNLVTNPNDPALGSLLSAAVKNAADALQGLLQTLKGSDPGAKECDEAMTVVADEQGRINKNPMNLGGNFNDAADELTSQAKALAAATSHAANIAKSNPAGLGTAARNTGQIIPGLVSAGNQAAGAAPDRQQAQNIARATEDATKKVGNLLLSAKMAAAKQDDEQAQIDLGDAARACADAIKNLMSTVSNETPAQIELGRALDAIKEATDKFNSSDLSPINGDPYDALANAAKALALATSKMVQAGQSDAPPDTVSAHAAQIGDAMGDVVEKTKATAAIGSSDTFGPAAKKVYDAVSALQGSCAKDLTPQTKQEIINCAKDVAGQTSALVNAARKTAAGLKDKDPQLSNAMLQSAQAIANATAGLVNAAKNNAAGAPNASNELQGASSELKDSIGKLVDQGSASGGSFNPQTLSPESEQLVNSVKSIASSAGQLVQVSKEVVTGKKSKAQAQPQLAAAAKGVTNSIQQLLNAAKFIKPGAKELQSAIDTVQKGSADLQNASLNAAIGLLENVAPPGTTYQGTQEQLVDATKAIAGTIKDFVNAARASPVEMGIAAEKAANEIPKIVNISLQAASVTSDQNQQQTGLDKAKQLTDSVLGLMQAAKSGDPKQLAEHAKATSGSIGDLLSGLQGGVMGLRECDNAIQQINQSAQNLDKDLGQFPTKVYQEAQNDLTNSAKALAGSLNSLVGKANQNEVGPASSQTAKVVEDLIQTTMQTAASTNEKAAQRNLIDAMKAIAGSTGNIINEAKILAADPQNQPQRQKLANTFKDVTQSISGMIAAMKSGATGEIKIQRAVDDINKVMADLDAASLFAAAGQLESAEHKGLNEQQCNDLLLNAAKQMATASSQLVNGAKGTQEQLGDSAEVVADSIASVVSSSKAAASVSSDPQSQQSLLTGARAVAIASQQLVLAGKNAQQDKGNQQHQGDLSKSSSNVADAVKQLVGLTQSASAEASRGLMELDKAKNDIGRFVQDFDGPGTGNDKAGADEVITAAKSLAESTAHLVAACNGSPEDLVKSAREAAQATQELLENTKGGSALAKDPEVTKRVRQNARNTAAATVKLLESAKEQRNNPNPQTQTKLSETSGDVVDRINDLVESAGALPGGAKAQELFRTSENLEEIAEKELMAAAKIIEDAAAFLLNAKHKRKKKAVPGTTIDESDITDAILDAARAIAQATAILVKAASQTQKEIVAAGKAARVTSVYRRDPTWAKGLISAAQQVAGSVQLLVNSANSAAQGNADEEELTASAKSVAASTARLVAASRAKADPLSPTQKKLSDAAKAVASATSQLVDAAKSAKNLETEEEEEDRAAQTYAGRVKKEMEQQVKILKLQKELERAQNGLHKLRKDEYAEETGGFEPQNNVPAAVNASPQRGFTPREPAPSQQSPDVVKSTNSPATPKAAPTIDRFYSIDEIRQKPPGIDVEKMELYLSDDDFMSVFKMPKEQFSKLPAWRSRDMKMKANLF